MKIYPCTHGETRLPFLQVSASLWICGENDHYSPPEMGFQFQEVSNIHTEVWIVAGVKVTYISVDWKELYVSMSLRWFNRNAVGTHFEGSLYSMIDPHLMLLLMKLLGKQYLVWDKTADIENIKASKKKLVDSGNVYLKFL